MLPVDGWRDPHNDPVVASQAELSSGSQMGVNTRLTIFGHILDTVCKEHSIWDSGL
jgi:hypothetical protein